MAQNSSTFVRIAALFAALTFLIASTQGRESSRALGIFNIIKFANDGCKSKDGTLHGVCYKEDECMTKGGKVDGNCASGFGKCCIFTSTTCGGTISNNGTYINNPGYPAAVTTAQTCKWMIDRSTDPEICFVRLDFDKFKINGPTMTHPTVRGNCDTDKIVFSSGGTVKAPTLCGDLSGTHIYLEPGRGGADPMVTTTLTGAGTRNWKMRVSMIPCDTLYTPDSGCQMYFMETSGYFMSYNYNADKTKGYHLNNMDYKICIRESAGFCNIMYTPVGKSSFEISSAVNEARTGTGRCFEDYVFIRDGHNGDNKCMARFRQPSDGDRVSKPVFTSERYCGNFANCIHNAVYSSQIFSKSKPFQVRLVTSDNDDQADITRGQQGFKMSFTQLPC